MSSTLFYAQKIIILVLICALSTGGLLASDMAAPQSTGNAPAKSTAKVPQKSKSHKGSIIGAIVGAGIAAGGAVYMSRPTTCHYNEADYPGFIVPCSETPPYKDSQLHKKLWGGTMIGVGAAILLVSLLKMGGPKDSVAWPLQKRDAVEVVFLPTYPNSNAIALSNFPIEIGQALRVRPSFSMSQTASNRATPLAIREFTLFAGSDSMTKTSSSREVGLRFDSGRLR